VSFWGETGCADSVSPSALFGLARVRAEIDHTSRTVSEIRWFAPATVHALTVDDQAEVELEMLPMEVRSS